MKGILFSEPMFNAVIEGRKTQTRRLIKPQPECAMQSVIHKSGWEDNHGRELKPRYKIGETHYLKEPYHIDNDGFTYYKYHHRLVMDYHPSIWDNKLFMPEKCARFHIQITDVRCQNVISISDEDCFAEGILIDERLELLNVDGKLKKRMIPYYTWFKDGFEYNTPKQAFAALFNSIYGKDAFEQMPFVWVYDFKLLK